MMTAPSGWNRVGSAKRHEPCDPRHAYTASARAAGEGNQSEDHRTARAVRTPSHRLQPQDENYVATGGRHAKMRRTA
jgi:hypothetical protein